MRYLISSGDGTASDAPALRRLAGGETLVLEGPWPLATTSLAYIDGDSQASALSGVANAYTVEGFASPGDGQAFAIAAHKMLDPDGFRPYAEAIPDLLARFGVRSLARGGKVTPLAGDFAPDRGVVLEFPSVEALVDFYTSDVYAPLLALRWRTTDPRFVVLARSGTIPPAARRKAEAHLAGLRR